jgi:4a-hydroxytetrahydrobiopterin dehydratase
MELIEPPALADALTHLDGWEGDTTGISRTLSLSTFPAAISAVDRIALVAEEINHHPDIDIRWRTLTLRVTTWEADGHVTDLDLDLAARIDTILNAATGR